MINRVHFIAAGNWEYLNTEINEFLRNGLKDDEYVFDIKYTPFSDTVIAHLHIKWSPKNQNSY